MSSLAAEARRWAASISETINMKRPPVIWLTQSLLILFALLLLSAFLLNVAVLLTHWGNELSIVRIIIVYAVWLGMALHKKLSCKLILRLAIEIQLRRSSLMSAQGFLPWVTSRLTPPLL